MTHQRLPFHGGQDREAAPAYGRHERGFAAPCIWLAGFGAPRAADGLDGMLTMETKPRPEMLEACGLG